MVDLATLASKMVSRGFFIQHNENGSFNFMFEGGTYYADSDPTDDKYIRIGFAKFYVVSNSQDRLRILEITNKLTESMKGVKIYLIDEQVYCSIEQYVPDVEFAYSMLFNYLRSLQEVVKNFAERVRAQP